MIQVREDVSGKSLSILLAKKNKQNDDACFFLCVYIISGGVYEKKSVVNC